MWDDFRFTQYLFNEILSEVLAYIVFQVTDVQPGEQNVD